MTAIVLVQPEIAGNTGAVGRTCVALDMELVLIRPYGFTITDARLKRAGLDYWQHVRLAEFDSWQAFLDDRQPRDDQLFLFEEFGETSFYDAGYPDDALLVFGQETKGLPAAIVDAHRERLVKLPMRSAHIRSLNLANTVTAAAYQALRGKL
ncbi:tRNA (uridine(34)/cytosine(34)/5-carboxymethylaminomethyluridine(34)-2'-O)-methyltransferase TrmL [Erythrobacter arachoides]|uniref:tRNA (cytidine(34)-2'-O)-methyltransferase n=1 Tax=Aurantiacibacter arachoides TaxID=1850444 RepID=A0A844ZVT2_9SPHN|nr:tRNA (cytidine(34)-2'-O)-methyltransferase [Aurantiacibacter arachoides]MXO92411.1 tRNA (uridine(34)/cytosine(34)/5-carboxymethylaminomethyluridine(34)-2'-O)-methyltransferase TrmL [Aurantiacibacter arachoides]GGD57381.1 putative tRNA (cytidine(34)-2'-O)-methyltransferase [Aurantiacibacter arachoides]